MSRKSIFSERSDKFLEVLKGMRIKGGITQVQAAESLKRPQSFVSKCESGERRVDIIEFLDFCKAYDIRPEAAFAEVVRKCQ